MPTTLAPVITFQQGRLPGDEVIPIDVLQVVSGGDVVQSRNSDDADLIMDDLIELFNSELHYRIQPNSVKRMYVSTVIVEFRPDLKNVLSSIALIEAKINGRLGDGRALKKLSFGYPEQGDTMPIPHLAPLAVVENAELTIERRVGSKTEQNRYFCSGPLRTSELISLLEEIEEVSARDFL